MFFDDLTGFVLAMTYLGAGLCMGFGAIGAGIGEGFTAGQAVGGISRQPKIEGELLRTMLLGQAVSESSGIFSLVIALVLVFSGEKSPTMPQAMAVLGGGLAMGLSAIGSGIGTGLAGGLACKSIARQPAVGSKVTGTMLLGQAIATSPSVFGFIVALMLVIPLQEAESITRAAAMLGAGIAMGIGAIGPGIGIGWVASRACLAAGWNRTVIPALNRTMLLAGAVSETTSIYSFVVAILLIYMTV